MLREVIRVSICESVLKVEYRVFVNEGTRLLVVVEMVNIPKDFTPEYMGLVVVGCPVVQRG
jgi:predicted ATP-grasp superfamily ATP-dependent carboligase